MSQSATLNGTVYGHGLTTNAWFEYGTTSGSYSNKTSKKTVQGTTNTPVSTNISGLTPGTTYYYRIAAKNNSGSVHGDEKSFTIAVTPDTKPIVETDSATIGTLQSAMLQGWADGRGLPTKAWFEYGTTSGSYINETSKRAVKESKRTLVRIEITGLTPGITYYYRIAAENSSGIAYGDEKTFTISTNYIIFTGIEGGGPGDLDDKKNNDTATWINTVIKFMIDEYVTCDLNCGPLNMEYLTEIANNNLLGGIWSIGFHITNYINSYSCISGPGNSTRLKTAIETKYNENEPAKVFIVGFSVGGGDVQNLLLKLKTLGIPVELSGHIDSVEGTDSNNDFGDAKIPDNTKRAMGFYHTGGACPVEGENNLYAENTQKTEVTNKPISKPKGPDKICGSHRNMDNDKRVWSSILNKIQQRIKGEIAPLLVSESKIYNTNLSSPTDFIDILVSSNDPEEKRQVRREFAKLQPVDENLKFILNYYYDSLDEELKLHLQSVISQIDSSDIVPQVKNEASKTHDEALFISLVYSLRKANNKEAKKASLELIDENELYFGEQEKRTNRQGINAIYSCLFDTVKPSDSAWLMDFIKDYPGSNTQINIISWLSIKYPSKEMYKLLDTAYSSTNDYDLKLKIKNHMERMEQKIK